MARAATAEPIRTGRPKVVGSLALAGLATFFSFFSPLGSAALVAYSTSGVSSVSVVSTSSSSFSFMRFYLSSAREGAAFAQHLSQTRSSLTRAQPTAAGASAYGNNPPHG